MARLFALLLLLFSACSSPTDGGTGDDGTSDASNKPPTQAPAEDGIYYVALDGSDTTGDGSSASPWRSIGFAAASVPSSGGVVIVVRPGVYDGPTAIERSFDSEVTIRSEIPYGATLSNITSNETILYLEVQGPMRLAIEDFVISNEGSTGSPCSFAAGHMIQMTNVSDVTFRNNVIYGNDRMPRCNEAIKINLSNALFFPTGIRFEGNLLSTPPSVDNREMIDVFEPGELDFVGNIFVSNRGEGAGEAFIKLWGEWGSNSARSPRYRIQRNVFINYEGNSTKGFLELGGEGATIYEISDALIENNLFVGGSQWPMAAPLVLRGVQDVTIRANSFVGSFAAGAFVAHVGTDGSNPTSRRVRLTNNVFSDPFATMPNSLLTTFGSVDVGSFTLSRNLYWNGGAALPDQGALTPADDTAAIVADPLILAEPASPLLPVWNAAARQFVSGRLTIRGELVRLACLYAAMQDGSPARSMAAPSDMPADDILGKLRDTQPDLGAFEHPGGETLIRRGRHDTPREVFEGR